MKLIILGLLCLCIFRASADVINPVTNEDPNVAERWNGKPDHAYDINNSGGGDLIKEDEGQELDDTNIEKLEEQPSTENDSEESKQTEMTESANTDEIYDEKALESANDLKETDLETQADDKQVKAWGWRRRRRRYISRRRANPCAGVIAEKNRCIAEKNRCIGEKNRCIGEKNRCIAEKNRLYGIIRDRDNRIRYLMSVIGRKNARIQRLQARVARLIAIVRRMRARIQKLRASLRYVVRRHNALARRFNRLLAAARRLKAKYLYLLARYRQVVAQNKQLRVLVKQQSNQIQSLKAQNAQLQAQNAQHIVDKKALRADVKMYKRKFNKAQYDLQKCRICCDACTQKNPQAGKNNTVTTNQSTKTELNFDEDF